MTALTSTIVSTPVALPTADEEIALGRQMAVGQSAKRSLLADVEFPPRREAELQEAVADQTIFVKSLRARAFRQ